MNVGEVVKNGAGTLTLTGDNTYGDNVGWIGFTTVNAGVLQADRDVGLPWGSCLNLNGGVLQSNSAVTFDTGFWWDWGFVIWNGGGFSAGGGKMTVNLYGDGRTLTWGDDGYVNLAGNMVLSSPSAQYETEIQNAIDLNGAARSIRVNDNASSSGDYASVSGVITDSDGVASLTKSGPGTLVIKGSSANTYTGDTNMTEGNLVLGEDLRRRDSRELGDVRPQRQHVHHRSRAESNRHFLGADLRRRLLAALRNPRQRRYRGGHLRCQRHRRDRKYPMGIRHFHRRRVHRQQYRGLSRSTAMSATETSAAAPADSPSSRAAAASWSSRAQTAAATPAD